MANGDRVKKNNDMPDTDALADILGVIDDFDQAKLHLHPFYTFEPWDVEERPGWVLQQAIADGIDLDDEDFVKHVGKAPRPFQTGYFMGTEFFAGVLGATQIGKSMCPKIEVVIMLTGELPICFRYDKGVDTGIARPVTEANIKRWGRRRIETGEIIDYDPKPKENRLGNIDRWNCGNIIGAGHYPAEKIAPADNRVVWIGTHMKTMNEYWWPSMGDPAERSIIPEHLFDTSRAKNGVDSEQHIFYLKGGARGSFITYETGFRRVEGKKVWCYVADEEPQDPNIIQSAQTHSVFMRLVMTPYNGITYTKDLLFPKQLSPDKKLYHATQYDSPYQSRRDIERQRQNMKSWDIGARVWGMHTATTGKPFFDRDKITAWIRRFRRNFKYVRLVPDDEYVSIGEPMDGNGKSLLAVNVSPMEVDGDNRLDTWRVYEDVQEDVAYAMGLDSAEGGENPEDAGDSSTALIMRPAMLKEPKPIMVATLRSTLTTVQFARVASHGLRHFNNALLCLESRRGAAAAATASELAAWPYWMRMTVISDATRKVKNIRGFDTNSATRDGIFKLIGSWINDCPRDEYPYIPDESLLVELAAAITTTTRGGKVKCDHPHGGSLDMTIAFGILLYVFKSLPDQVQFNGDSKQAKQMAGRLARIMARVRGSDSRTKPLYLGQI
uniref:Uncharacterized protein n=1 Tax=viral metagenome TaxID=1070528 RepID=A0A6M3JU16_9ZZZZ